MEVQRGRILFYDPQRKVYRTRLESGAELWAIPLVLGRIFPQYSAGDLVLVIKAGNKLYIAGALPSVRPSDEHYEEDVIIESGDAKAKFYSDGNVSISGSPTAQLGINGPNNLLWAKAENLSISSTYYSLFAQTLPAMDGGTLDFKFQLSPGVEWNLQANLAFWEMAVGPTATVRIYPTTGIIEINTGLTNVQLTPAGTATITAGGSQIVATPTGVVTIGTKVGPKSPVCTSLSTICPILQIPHVGTPNVLAG